MTKEPVARRRLSKADEEALRVMRDLRERPSVPYAERTPEEREAGRRRMLEALRRAREAHAASGRPFLTPDEVNREVQERRGGVDADLS